MNARPRDGYADWENRGRTADQRARNAWHVAVARRNADSTSTLAIGRAEEALQNSPVGDEEGCHDDAHTDGSLDNLGSHQSEDEDCGHRKQEEKVERDRGAAQA
jgi:hypothetical protein